MSTATVDIVDLGPIKKLSIPIPERGGVVVLRGRNGRGKSQALQAIESHVTGNGKVSVRDGALNGRVEGFGATMTVGRSTQRRGELEVVTLDSKLKPADLVDPHMKTPDAADAKRIQALVQLSGVIAEPSLFWELVGGQQAFEAICAQKIKGDEDPVQLATRIKAAFEEAARLEESRADTATGHANAHKDAAGSIDTTAPSDSAELQAALEQAIRGSSELNSRAREAKAAQESAERARAELAKIKSDGVIDELAAADEHAHAIQLLDEAVEVVRQAEENLRKARLAEGEARNFVTLAKQKREAAEKQKQLITGWEAAIETAARHVAPTDEEIAAATNTVESARQAVERGVLIRDALKRLGQAKTFESEAAEHTAQATLLRNAAAGTYEVLSSLVQKLGTPLRVEAGRLVLNTPRGDTYFGELSHGERWKIVIDLCVDVIGAAGELTIPQEAWEGLDTPNRNDIAAHAERLGILILTAESSEDETVTAEVYQRN